MLLDKLNYSLFVDEILKIFFETFGESICFVKKSEQLGQRNYFKIDFKYIPLKYMIVLESDRNVFSIDIYDDEGAKNSLYRLEKFDNQTEIKKIAYAIEKLKEVLDENDFCFYVTKGGKTYKKEKQKYQRIRSLADIIRNE